MSKKIQLLKPMVKYVDGVLERFEAGDDVPIDLFAPKEILNFTKSGHIKPGSVPSAKEIAEAAKAQRKAQAAKASAKKEEEESKAAKAAAELAARRAEKEAAEALKAKKIAEAAEKEAKAKTKGRKRNA